MFKRKGKRNRPTNQPIDVLGLFADLHREGDRKMDERRAV